MCEWAGHKGGISGHLRISGRQPLPVAGLQAKGTHRVRGPSPRGPKGQRIDPGVEEAKSGWKELSMEVNAIRKEYRR